MVESQIKVQIEKEGVLLPICHK